MDIPVPYALADKAISKLNKTIIKRFRSASSKFLIEKFDELYVVRQTRSLYETLDNDNREEYLILFKARYLEAYAYAYSGRRQHGTEDELDELFELSELYLSGKLKLNGENPSLSAKLKKKVEKFDSSCLLLLESLLSNPNSVTGYSYDTEVMRKRERCEESINAANGAAKKKAAMNKALRFWGQQSQQYADIVSEKANREALRKAQVRYVRWMTQEDERVCGNCKSMKGKIYRIDRIPDNPHWRCRCYCIPASTPVT